MRAATPSNFVQVERYFRRRTGSTGAYGILVRYALAKSSLRLAALARGWENQPFLLYCQNWDRRGDQKAWVPVVNNSTKYGP